MEFVSLDLEGVFGITGESFSDPRGILTRIWDSDSIPGNFKLNQGSFVSNPLKGTLRGLHYQENPFSENKVIICTSGKVFDVILDLREDSATFGVHLEIELGPEETYLGLFVPAGFAHGYLTLEQNSSLVYFMDKEYSPNYSRGILWSDANLSIDWPTEPVLISERDSNWPGLT